MIKACVVFLSLGAFLVADGIKKREWTRPSTIPAPKNNPITKEKISLGKKLFFDPILSRGNNISCMTCHNPLKGWSDSDTVAIGDKGRKGERNSPTILNSAYQYIYFFDGRAKSLEEQALGPIESHVEMNLDPTEAVKKLQNNSLYREMFKTAFPNEKITTATLAKALATFQRTIVSGESRFDKYVNGDKTQLSKEELNGFYTFNKKANCTICHSGFNFSDQSFNNIGINNEDLGRGKVKKRTIWNGAFKTPTLRNISNSAPYFHDGSAATLKEAVAFCAKGSRDKKGDISKILIDKHLSEKEIIEIVNFLKTLSEPIQNLH